MAGEVKSMAEILMDIMEQFNPIKDAVLGYRSELIAGGVGADIADEMARDMHHLLAETVMQGISTNNRGEKT